MSDIRRGGVDLILHCLISDVRLMDRGQEMEANVIVDGSADGIVIVGNLFLLFRF